MSSSHKQKNVFREEWVKSNVFSFRKGDAVAYMAFYILIPIIITVISLVNFPANDIAAVYCYVTILVSALNSLYDAGNRWDSARKSVKNTKLFIMFCGSGIVTIYALVVVFGMLIAERTIRCDWVLFSYVLVVIVAVFDFAACFFADMSIKELVAS